MLFINLKIKKEVYQLEVEEQKDIVRKVAEKDIVRKVADRDALVAARSAAEEVITPQDI